MKHVFITDHALVRYLQRVRGIDVEAIRAQLAAECGPAIQLGAKTMRSGGLEYRFDGAKLITIYVRGAMK